MYQIYRRKKTADYLETKIRSFAEFIDPKKVLIDLICFDGAGNVQKAGRLLEKTFPRATTIHGCEHVCSLFFVDLLKKTELKVLINLYWVIYKVFGSGSMHLPHAIFIGKVQDIFNRKLGLIKAAGTQFCSWFYAFSRLLCLRNALKNTIASSEWMKHSFEGKKS